MRPIALMLVFLPCMANAEGWQRLDAPAIEVALSDQTLIYDSAWQRFYASGKTLYNSGHDSWGTWWAEGEHYCSTWPPASGKACYAVEAQGDQIRFIGESGDITTGSFK